MAADILEDVRARAPAERLLEESWAARVRRAPGHELVSEAACALAFLAVAIPLAAAGERPRASLCALLVVVVAIVSRTVRVPVGAGHVVPTYLVLVPMLVLLGPEVTPLLLCAGQVLGSLVRWTVRRGRAEEILFSVPDAWSAIGPAVVLAVAGHVTGVRLAVVSVIAFASGCLLDLVASTIREWLASGIAPRVQGRVVLTACALDACFAPLGLGIAVAARHSLLGLLLLLPLGGLLAFSNRDRTARIAQEQERLAVLARERTRLQSAVHRLGDAFAAKLDLGALADVLLRSSVEALDAGAGGLALGELAIGPIGGEATELTALLDGAARAARRVGHPIQSENEAGWALAIPLVVSSADAPGVLVLARRDRGFSDDERALVGGLVARAEVAAAEIIAHGHLRHQLRLDPLTGLGNRRGLAEELAARLPRAGAGSPLRLAVFDLDGFKDYNDTHGHPAGDALLHRLGERLRAAVAPDGAAFRLGGDEFCALLPGGPGAEARLSEAASALRERRDGSDVRASYGSVDLPAEAATAEEAMVLADARMYAHKHGERPWAGRTAQRSTASPSSATTCRHACSNAAA